MQRLDRDRNKWFEREPTWRRNVQPSRLEKPLAGKKPRPKPTKPATKGD